MEPKEETQKWDLRAVVLQHICDASNYDAHKRKGDLTSEELTNLLCAEIEAHMEPKRSNQYKNFEDWKSKFEEMILKMDARTSGIAHTAFNAARNYE